jgi:glutamate dehydrogenase
LFDLPRSSWDDYDRKLISKGGGVFARTEKSVKITPEMKKAYAIAADTLAPAELMQAMLKAEVELMYFGGIGTYVKASDETHDEVGDRANEALRVNGIELRAKVVGEGANLGMTQRGRVEYAQKGGRLNTDAIDNSAGVDTSDHEVNIKVLLRRAIDKKKLTIPARNKLLAGMTDEVGHLVLRDNYLQTEALSLSEARAPDTLSIHVRCMQMLEKSGLLNRAVEYMPDDAEISARQKLGKGLTRPELAVLLAYAKIWIYHKILDSDLPDDPALMGDVVDYFPAALRKSYADDIAHHQLRREIAATVVTNDIVNRTGIRIILAMAERGNPAVVTRAYLLARAAFALPEIWAGIEALDNKVPAATQTRMLLVVHTATLRAMDRLIVEREQLAKLSVAIEASRKGLAQLGDWMRTHAHALDANVRRVETDWRAEGVPDDLARRVALFPVLVSAFGLTMLAAKTKVPIGDLAAIFFDFEKRLEIGWLGRLTSQSVAQTPWQREAAAAALEELASNHRRLTAQLAARKDKSKAQNVAHWAAQNAPALERYDAMLTEWRAVGAVDLAMLLLANETLSALSA